MANCMHSLKRLISNPENQILVICVVHLLFDLIQCRNVRGHSRYSHPRPDPHIVKNSPDSTSAEVAAKDQDKQLGRRCQVTKVEEKENFFEMPYYNEGRTIFPFFIKISGTLQSKTGKCSWNVFEFSEKIFYWFN